MGRMWSVPVVPIRIRVETSSDCLRAHRHRRPTYPQLHILEDPLDLRVELPCPDLASDVNDAKRLNTLVEHRSELAAMIGHQKSRRSSTALDRRHDQLHQILRSWFTAIRLHRDDLPAEAVDDGRNLDLLPEYPDLGHVQMSHLIRLRRVAHMCRRLSHTNWRMLFRQTRRALLKHSPDRCPAYSDARSHNVPSDRPRPELWLRESLSNLVNKPADAIVQSVSRRAAEQLLGFEFVMNSLLPIADRVGVNDETGTRLLGRPPSELHDNKDLGSLRGRAVQPLVCGLPHLLGSENGSSPSRSDAL